MQFVAASAMSLSTPDARPVGAPHDQVDDLGDEENVAYVPIASAGSAFAHDAGFDHDDADEKGLARADADEQEVGGEGYRQNEARGKDGSAYVKEEGLVPAETKEEPATAQKSAAEARSRVDEHVIYRRRRDVRAARDRLGEQFEQLRRVLPDPPAGVELNAKAQVLEHSLDVIQNLMRRATDLAMELAVVTPEATRLWVRNASDDGRKPLMHSVTSVMKLFAARKEWRYAEWWTLDEKRNVEEEEEEGDGGHEGANGEREKPMGVVEDPANVHGCVVRDSVSVMRLGWTLIQRSMGSPVAGSVEEKQEDEDMVRFAKASSVFEFKPRIGMPGRVWTSRRAEWLIDLGDREIFQRSPLAKQFGMKTCLAVPIQFGGHVHSVMAFYSREVRGYDPECYDLACLLSQCLEEVYSPSNAGPWQVSEADLFPCRPVR